MIRRPPRSTLFPYTRSSDLVAGGANESDLCGTDARRAAGKFADNFVSKVVGVLADLQVGGSAAIDLADDRRRRGIAQVKKRSEEHTSELQSRLHLVCRLLLQ